MTVRIAFIPQEQLPDHVAEQIHALEAIAWPEAAGAGAARRGRDPALSPEAAVAWVRDRVVASLFVVGTRLHHAGADYRACGLSAVVTHPDLRGRGIGLRLVAAAHARMRTGGADLGIFTCDPSLADFYRRDGWRVLAGSVLIGGTPERPLRSDDLGLTVLADFFSDRAVRAVHAFHGAEIALHPGPIDRLW